MSNSEDEIEDYAAMVAKMDPDLAGPNQALLVDFVTLIATKQDFELRLEDVTLLLQKHGIKKKEENIGRLLLGKRQGLDYKVTCEKRGPRQGRTKNNVW